MLRPGQKTPRTRRIPRSCEILQEILEDAGLQEHNLNVSDYRESFFRSTVKCVRSEEIPLCLRRRVVQSLRARLQKLNAHPQVIATASWRYLRCACESKPKPKAHIPYCDKLKLPPEHPTRRRLEAWHDMLLNDFGFADITASNILRYAIYRVLPVVAPLALKQNSFTVVPISTSIVHDLCTPDAKAKLRWLQIILGDLLESELAIPEDCVATIRHMAKTEKKDSRTPTTTETNGGRDVHCFSAQDLDKLNAVRADILDELFLWVSLTTGIRIGAFVRMRCEDVAERDGGGQGRGHWYAKDEGTTIEKDGRRVIFKFHSHVQTLVTLWLNDYRPITDSPFVFPSVTSPVCHMPSSVFYRRFKNMCKRAGLVGPQCHPHALRHTFCHMMFSIGNSPYVVSKLMNHTSEAVTKRWYLKESPQQATERLTAPWFESPLRSLRPPSVPRFLLADTDEDERCVRFKGQSPQINTN